jgi:hypothetical protein
METTMHLRIATLGLALLPCSCASYTALSYGPAIQDVELREEAATRARLTVAWRAIEKVREEGRDPHRVVFRVRIENVGETNLVLADSEFTLLDANLLPFDRPWMEGWPDALAPHAEATATLRFALPPGQEMSARDLSALNLSATLQGGRWTWSTTFEQVPWRDPYPYGDPYWSGRWRWYFHTRW